MPRLAAGAALITFAGTLLFAAKDAQTPTDQPRYVKGNQLVRPQNYREWIYLSSGLGMEYGAPSYGPQKFTNVFVVPSAYRQFVATGKWPDKTMFALEERASSSKGSINKAGRYQSDLVGFNVALKDEKRFPEKWAYFVFGAANTASPMPKPACWQCHNEHGAVDNTFVQFYPTLKTLARKFGVYDERKASTEPDNNR